MGRILIEAGNTPISLEAMEALGEDLRKQLGDAHELEISAPLEERGAEPIDPYVFVVLSGIQATAAVIAAVATMVSAWRERKRPLPKKILRVVLEEEDQDGNRRRVWMESES
jgi:hypothetical protein